MDQRSAAAEFLRTRRDRITPDRAGIAGGGRRRVPGLRREEVALLAGVSVDYYARMERGDLTGVSPEVLEGLAHALQLDEAELRTCTTWLVRQGRSRRGAAAALPNSRYGRPCSDSSTRSPARRCGSATAA